MQSHYKTKLADSRLITSEARRTHAQVAMARVKTSWAVLGIVVCSSFVLGLAMFVDGIVAIAAAGIFIITAGIGFAWRAHAEDIAQARREEQENMTEFADVLLTNVTNTITAAQTHTFKLIREDRAAMAAQLEKMLRQQAVPGMENFNVGYDFDIEDGPEGEEHDADL